MGDQRFLDLCYRGVQGVQAAIDNGADVNEEDPWGGGNTGRTGLMWALCKRQNNVVQLLLNHPQIDINKVDCYERCALQFIMLC